MSEFAHLRHLPPRPLARPRELVVACPPLRSNVNLSRIARTAGCCAVERLICCGTGRLIDRVARDGADGARLPIEIHRTLPPVVRRLRGEGYQIVGLEQARGAESLHAFQFERRTVLTIGNERAGLGEELLAEMDRVVEIPVWGLPHSYNVATATAITLYEYCRQFPDG